MILARSHEETTDASKVVQYLFAHPIRGIAPLLTKTGISVSGRKEDLRERLLNRLQSGSISLAEALTHLNSIEGWGNQHVYLYESSPEQARAWRSEDHVKQCLSRIDADDLINACRPLLLPESPTLTSIEWTPARVRFIWVERRDWLARREDLDDIETIEHRIVRKAYEEKVSRGITSLDWCLSTGHASLLISRLPRGEDYATIRREYETAIQPALDLATFRRVRITQAIERLESSSETKNRQVAHETQRGSQAKFTSRGRQDDAYDDPDVDGSRRALGRTVSVLGNFYWNESPPALTRRIHGKLFAADHRVGIFGQCSEQEVRHVLSRIRHHCR